MNDIDNLGTHAALSDASAHEAHEAREACRRELMKRFAHSAVIPAAADASQELDKYDLSTLACTD